MSGHTRGPWRVFAPWQVDREDALPGGTVIAQCHEDVHAGRSVEERNANACLISAAPDLLEATKQLEQLFLDNLLDDATDEENKILDFADAAIDKAEGKE